MSENKTNMETLTMNAIRKHLDTLQSNESDYWVRLEHQAAVSAMQAILTNPVLMQGYAELANVPITSAFLNKYVLVKSVNIAHELIEKLKEEN